MANDPIRRGEWDRYREATDRRIDDVEQWQRDHDEDEEERAKEARGNSQWTVTRTLAVVTTAVALLGLLLQAMSRH